jgi:hypothetical protein
MTKPQPVTRKINHAITDDEQQLTSTYNDSSISFLYNNNGNKSTVNDLDLPQGLIELLVESNFTVESLLDTNPSELSNTLAIDIDVAAIIYTAANKKNNKHRKKHSSHRIDHRR